MVDPDEYSPHWGLMTDADYMQLALLEAKQAARRGEVPVGAVLVNHAGDIIAKAGNAPIAICDPTAHAEILAIRQAAYESGNYRLSEVTLYVTLEPCAMCAGAIANARIARVVYGADDEKGGACQSGVQFFNDPSCHHKPEITRGILAQECSQILKDFFKDRRKAKSNRKPL
ncbi:MAG: tRNA adenosine(34) deaminase TadA [Litorimonas sp.]